MQDHEAFFHYWSDNLNKQITFPTNQCTIDKTGKNCSATTKKIDTQTMFERIKLGLYKFKKLMKMGS